MKQITLLIILFFSINTLKAQGNFETYKLFNSKGKEVSVKKLNKDISKHDIIFLGELHDNPISHWFFLELIKESNISQNGKIQVGAEMFERDNQILIDEYFQELISTSKFEDECRLWPNYKSDYKPTLEYCKLNKIDFQATNIPRRYASTVYKKGEKALDELSSQAKNWIAPIPIPFDSTLEVYRELQSFSGHGGINLAKAQAYKDATMAYFIKTNKKEQHTYFHLNGNKHSENHQAILWYLNQYKVAGEYLSIQTETSENLLWDEQYKDKADYILVVQKDIK